MNLRLSKTPTERREALEHELGISLKKIGEAETNEDAMIHCENRIGAVTIPVGIAGPVRVDGDHISGLHYIPLATTEGALVASVSRGMKAAEKGGIITQVEKEGVTRGPVFITSSLHEARRIEQWIWDHFDELARVAQSTSGHISLMNADIRHVGLYVFLRLNFDTDRAMGMNMATIASTQIANYIVQKTKAKLQSVAGNFDIDKKPAWMNALMRRGYVVNAETVIPIATVKSVFKTEPRDIYNVWKAKCMIGSALAGSIGFNAHHANIVAAFFAATGQDLAHVVDGSLGMTIVDILNDGSLYGSVYLPDVMLGTVGGGTKLNTQTEARSIMKTDSPFALAELLGAAVLAGELSLLASLSEGTLAKAHSTLGR